MVGIIKTIEGNRYYWDGNKFVTDPSKTHWFNQWITATEKCSKLSDGDAKCITGKQFNLELSHEVNELRGKLFAAINTIERYKDKYGKL